MKAVILAGGLGTRLAEETGVRPKPMVNIGGMPILWHIMKSYASHGIREFIICLGYKGHLIKQFFANYTQSRSSISINLATNQVRYHNVSSEPWTVHLVDTGYGSMTGGRLLRVREFLDDQPFCLTYGDGLTDANLSEEISFHLKHGHKATVLAVQPPGRFGIFELRPNESRVPSFHEKPTDRNAWVSGGYFVLNPSVLDYLEGDETVWEQEPMDKLAQEGELQAFRHSGFWQPMDTLRDKQYLESLWASGKAPWRLWDGEPRPTDRRGRRRKA